MEDKKQPEVKYTTVKWEQEARSEGMSQGYPSYSEGMTTELEEEREEITTEELESERKRVESELAKADKKFTLRNKNVTSLEDTAAGLKHMQDKAPLYVKNIAIYALKLKELGITEEQGYGFIKLIGNMIHEYNARTNMTEFLLPELERIDKKLDNLIDALHLTESPLIKRE